MTDRNRTTWRAARRTRRLFADGHSSASRPLRESARSRSASIISLKAVSSARKCLSARRNCRRRSMSPPLTSSKARLSSTNGPATRLVVKMASPVAANAITGTRVRRKNQMSLCVDGGTMPPIIIATVMTGAVSTTTKTQTAEYGHTDGRVCLNPLPRSFQFLFIVCLLVSETISLLTWLSCHARFSSCRPGSASAENRGHSNSIPTPGSRLTADRSPPSDPTCRAVRRSDSLLSVRSDRIARKCT